VPVTETRYTVRGWGTGELWQSGEVVIAHEFHFKLVSDTGAIVRTDVDRGDVSAGRTLVRRNRRSDHEARCGSGGTDLGRASLDGQRCLTPEALVSRFDAFLTGEDVSFDDVELDLGGATPFQCALADALRAVPRGEVVTYGELAALAGYPGAARAAGSFCAANRFSFLVPCHRVVAAHGIGSYGDGGVEVKRRLLALEGVRL
jgi:methylated-DNA-[protein]-cysteine S-methyltransferase